MTPESATANHAAGADGTARRLAFVCPRFAEGPTVGGAETLMRALAVRAARRGRDVTFFTTCARNHFTWENVLPEGERRSEGVRVRYFRVDAHRDVGAFLKVQDAISRGRLVSRAEEDLWLRNSVNSAALCEALRRDADRFDRIIAGPYLFGLVEAVSRIAPGRTLLAPCLHDEPFAYLASIREMFARVRGCLFNSDPERGLACRLQARPAAARDAVVGLGLDDFASDPRAFASRRGLAAPYIVYAGRREPLKGTPLLVDYLAAFRTRTRRDVKLVLTGSGPVDLPDALRPHVIDAGFVSERDKHDIMAGAAAFVHPSLNESLGIVILEAWLARTAALVRAASPVLRHQCRASNGGLWFRHYPDFEEMLVALLEDEALRRALAGAGRRYVLERYAWPAVEKRLLDALDA
ncbi:MAG: glycosyltransferase [Lentisphaerae bacterium]|nr:glycosyltransferase [Lentisphaerota bacterium]